MLLPNFRLRPAALLLACACTVLGQTAPSPPSGCQITRVTTLPGSRQFAADFIETVATDPDPTAADANVLWGLTADLSDKVPPSRQAIYLSKSVDGGRTWFPLASLDSRYFNAHIAEGLRNGLAVSPGGTDFVITTQMGAFQITPGQNGLRTTIAPLPGPVVPPGPPLIPIPKKPGEPVRAGVAKITADGQRLYIAYGYFDLNPQLLIFRRDGGHWVPDGTIPSLPSRLDIFSMAFDDPANPHPGSLYVGTGDQAYRLNLNTGRWRHIDGVGEDSAIHAMTTVGGLHLAACWGIYNPVGPDLESRVRAPDFLLHPGKDQVGPNIRAYDIQVDPLRLNREAAAVLTGVYISDDKGRNWRRVNGLPPGEYHTAHFNPDGSLLVSGLPGTFVAQPFDDTCVPGLRKRD
jgi:hypothetical protein